VPRVTVALAVTENVAVAAFPRLSVTVTVCPPVMKSAVVIVVGSTNWKAAVPCSVTVVGFGIEAIAVAPKVTPVKVAPGPNPDAFTVTSVPAGPEVGENVTAGAVKLKIAVPVLPWASVKVIDEPEVIFGRLTVPVYPPVNAPVIALTDIVLLLKDSADVTSEYAATAGNAGVVRVTVIVSGLTVPIRAEPVGIVPVNVPVTVTAA
jgi:hypothetical protein